MFPRLCVYVHLYLLNALVEFVIVRIDFVGSTMCLYFLIGKKFILYL